MADEPLTPENQNDNAPETPAETVAVHLAAENAELKDRLLRTMAEMENLRRRTEKEVADTRQYAVSSFAREVLTVGDNLRRALDAVPADQRDAAEGALSALLSGVELTERELLKILGKHGVSLIDPSGQKFDPHLHQAVFEVPDASVPSGTVVNVIQPGYVIGERVLRPAMVAVSKGGPKAPRAGDAKSAAGSDADAN